MPTIEHDKYLETGAIAHKIHELLVYSGKNHAQSRDKPVIQQCLESNWSPSSDAESCGKPEDVDTNFCGKITLLLLPTRRSIVPRRSALRSFGRVTLWL